MNKKEVALVELSRDFLALKAATECVEDENARLKGEINQLILNDREKQIFLEKGLENTRPIEMAQEYSEYKLTSFIWKTVLITSKSQCAEKTRKWSKRIRF